MSTHPDTPDEDTTQRKKGSLSEPTANPTPPDEDPSTAPGVKDTPQTAPDHQR